MTLHCQNDYRANDEIEYTGGYKPDRVLRRLAQVGIGKERRDPKSQSNIYEGKTDCRNDATHGDREPVARIFIRLFLEFDSEQTQLSIKELHYVVTQTTEKRR